MGDMWREICITRHWSSRKGSNDLPFNTPEIVQIWRNYTFLFQSSLIKTTLTEDGNGSVVH